MTNELSPVQIERELHKAPYRNGACEASNGHEMRYDVDVVGTGPDQVEYFVVSVRDSAGVVVAMSSSPEPDLEAEREFTLDFLLEQR